MKKQPKTTIKTPDLSGLSAAELRLVVAQFQAVIEEQNSALQDAHRRIELLEEMNRLLKTQKFSASSEKSKFQLNLFDESELEAHPMCQPSCRLNISEDNHGPLFTRAKRSNS